MYSKVLLQDQVIASIFTCVKFISLKIVVHILFVVKGVLPKDLEPMLLYSYLKVTHWVGVQPENCVAFWPTRNTEN